MYITVTYHIANFAFIQYLFTEARDTVCFVDQRNIGSRGPSYILFPKEKSQ